MRFLNGLLLKEAVPEWGIQVLGWKSPYSGVFHLKLVISQQQTRMFYPDLGSQNEEDGNSNAQATAAGKEPGISSGSGWWKGTMPMFQVKMEGWGWVCLSPQLSWCSPFLLHSVFGGCDFKGVCPSLKHQPLIPGAKVFISLRWQFAEISNGKIFF